jgi:hypothetical protein
MRQSRMCHLKKLIFFRYLPYWQELEIDHAIDTMHVAKGVLESTVGTLLDIPGKTKDGLRACKDQQKFGRSSPSRKTEWKVLPTLTSYNLTLEEKKHSTSPYER